MATLKDQKRARLENMAQHVIEIFDAAYPDRPEYGYPFHGSMANARATHERRTLGNLWFDGGAFFTTRYPDGDYITRYGGLFVSSELTFDGAHRVYTIRMAAPNGEIETIGEFQGFATLSTARNYKSEIERIVRPHIQAVLGSGY